MKIKDVQTKLKELRSQKSDINELGEFILESLHMTLLNYWKKHPKYFAMTCESLFLQKMLVSGGSNYFVWTEEKNIQKDFEKFILKELKSKNKYLFCKSKTLEIKKVQWTWTVRSADENTTFKFNDNGNLVYYYSGTTYDGFSSRVATMTQTITIDIDKLDIIDFTDSESRYTGGIFVNLNKDFIDKIKIAFKL
jgi:hypothetical protein